VPKPDNNPDKESFVFYDISPQLEQELLRRAEEAKTDPATEAAKIIEQHIEEEGGLD